MMTPRGPLARAAGLATKVRIAHLSADAGSKRVRAGQARIEDLRIGDARLDLTLRRHTHDVSVTIDRRAGDLEVSVLK